LNVNQIKSHDFFYGADWNSIRRIEPPFVPCLQSSTDTSYFPVEDYEDIPNQVERVEAVGAEQDLAFLGYVVLPPLPWKTSISFPFLAGSLSNASLVEFRRLAEPIIVKFPLKKDTRYTWICRNNFNVWISDCYHFAAITLYLLAVEMLRPFSENLITQYR
jgi:hypothetical protein